MAFKFIVVLAFIAVANGSGYAPLTREFGGELVKHTIDEFDPHPQYTFSYEVNDAVSGDSKGLIESRDGDIVRGEYSLIDADGYKRTVKYTADDVNGFNAMVDRQLLQKAPIAAPVVVKAPIATPIEIKSIVPVTYTAPSLIKSAPIEYGTPTFLKQSIAAPELIKYAPAFYGDRSAFNPTLAYASGSSFLRPLPLAAESGFPGLIRSADIAYSAPAHSFIRSAPAPYAQW